MPASPPRHPSSPRPGTVTVLGIRIAAAIVALCAVATNAPAAHAYRLGGERWPGRTITYYDATAYKGQVRAAVRTWNASGVRIRFKAAARGRAQVRIASGGRKGCFGFAQVGYASGRRAKVQLGAGCAYVSSMTGIVAHELGHILGLVHEDRRCAAMNTVLDAHCGLQPAFEYRCRLLERDDVRGAVTRYGGRVRPVRADPYCPSFAAPRTPAIRTIASSAGSVSAAVAIAAPDRLVADAGPMIFAELLVYRYANACPHGAGAGAGEPYLRSYVDYGAQTASLDVSAAPGTWCYALAVADTIGRRSPFATATVVVPQPAPEPLPLVPEPLPLGPVP